MWFSSSIYPIYWIFSNLRSRDAIDGTFLKEMRSMKHDMPAEFVQSLKEVFHFNTVNSIKFRGEIEKLE